LTREALRATRYIAVMIQPFRHAGLERFYLTGSKAGIQSAHAIKLRRQLTLLNTPKNPNRMDVHGWDLHQLKGTLVNHFSIKVNGNWRMTFKFENENAILVDYQDYY
jgi:proteic killer suppression protein